MCMCVSVSVCVCVLVCVLVCICVCVLVCVYRSHAKIRPPFLHFTSRNKRGVGVFTRNTQFYSKLGPPLRVDANGTRGGWTYVTFINPGLISPCKSNDVIDFCSAILS